MVEEESSSCHSEESILDRGWQSLQVQQALSIGFIFPAAVSLRWSRTLNMAKALSELQVELQNRPSALPFEEVGTDTKNPISHFEYFCPKTPAGKESRKSHKPTKRRRILFEEETTKVGGLKSEISVENHVTDCVHVSDESMPSSISLDEENEVYDHGNCRPILDGKVDSYSDVDQYAHVFIFMAVSSSTAAISSDTYNSFTISSNYGS